MSLDPNAPRRGDPLGGSTEPAERLERLVALLREGAARALGIEDPTAIAGDASPAELGIDSLMALDMCDELGARLGCVVPAQLMFEQPTFEALGRTLLAYLDDPASSVASALRTAAYGAPLATGTDDDVEIAEERWTSTIQELCLLEHQRLPGSLTTVLGYEILGELSVDALRSAFAEVIEHRALLRSAFALNEGRGERRVLDVGPQLEMVDASGWTDAQLAQHYANEAAAPLDLEGAAPLRCMLLRREPERHVLLLKVHHVAYDGVSVGVLPLELFERYATCAGDTSAPARLTRSYDRFVAWEERLLSAPAADELVSWWEDHLEGAEFRLRGRRRLPAEEAESFVMNSVPFALTEAQVAGLQRFAGARHGTLNMAVTAAWFAGLREVMGQDDLTLAMTLSLRNHRELRDVFGPVFDFVPLRAELTGVDGPAEVYARVRTRILSAMGHGNIPFRLLREHCLGDDDALPWFGLPLAISFYEAGELPSAALARTRIEGPMTFGSIAVRDLPLGGLPVLRPFDLTIGVFHLDGRIWGGLRYRRGTLEAGVPERIASAFISNAEALAQLGDPSLSS